MGSKFDRTKRVFYHGSMHDEQKALPLYFRLDCGKKLSASLPADAGRA